MCVRASGSNLSNFIFLGQRAIKEKSSTQRTLRENLKSTQRAHKIRVIPSEPKILRVVIFHFGIIKDTDPVQITKLFDHHFIFCGYF